MMAVIGAIMGCGKAEVFNTPVERSIPKDFDTYKVEGITGEVEIEGLLDYDDYLKMAEELYSSKPDEKTGLIFYKKIGDWTCGVNENCQIALRQKETNEEIVVMERPVSYMSILESRIYFLDMETNILMSMDLETAEINSVNDQQMVLPIIYKNNVYYLNESDEYCVNGLM